MTRTLRTPLALAAGLMLATSLAACGSETTDTATSAASQAGASASSAASQAGASASSAVAGATGAATGKTYTIAVVNDHDNESSCWAAIDGKVYDLTTWIGKHPGGPNRITSICGQDATDAFKQQHGDDNTPNKRLAGFEIGTLQK